jgi:predicted MFS family arabinose efflux permease
VWRVRDTPADVAPPIGLGSARPALLILGLAVFAGVTTETLPVGLLPAIGASVGTSVGTTGLLVGLYAALVAVLAVPLTLATRRVPRRRLLLIATACLAVSNLGASLAPSFALLAGARALGGATHAVFFSVGIGYAARLVPAGLTGRALALASAGISAGFVLGVPLATIIGDEAGWRTAFGVLAALLAAVFVLIVTRLPVVASTQRDAPTHAARRSRLVPAVAANGLVYLGHYALYTYVSVVLLRSGATQGAVGPILIVFGAVALVGIRLAGPHMDARPRAAALVILLTLALGLAACGVGVPALVPVVLAGALWNGAFGPVAAVFQSAAVRTNAVTPDLAGAWVVATSNLGIAAGAAIGGLLLHRAGIPGVAGFGAAAVLGAAAVVLGARSAFPRG